MSVNLTSPIVRVMLCLCLCLCCYISTSRDRCAKVVSFNCKSIFFPTALQILQDIKLFFSYPFPSISLYFVYSFVGLLGPSASLPLSGFHIIIVAIFLCLQDSIGGSALTRVLATYARYLDVFPLSQLTMYLMLKLVI